MLFGMGTVFVFLSILIVTTVLMSWVINHFFEQEPPASAAPAVDAPRAPRDQIESNLLDILQAAVNAHKNPK